MKLQRALIWEGNEPTSIRHQPERKDTSKPVAPNKRYRQSWLWRSGQAHHQLQVQHQGHCCMKKHVRAPNQLVESNDYSFRHTVNCLILTFKLNQKSIHSSITALYMKWIPKISRKEFSIIVFNIVCSLYYNI